MCPCMHIIIHTMSHHHTYIIHTSYILCHIIIHTKRRLVHVPMHAYSWCMCVWERERERERREWARANACYTQKHTLCSCVHVCLLMLYVRMNMYVCLNMYHHPYYVTSSYILCHIIIHTMSHHHTYYVTSSYIRICVWTCMCVWPCAHTGCTHEHVSVNVNTHHMCVHVCLYR